MLFKFWTFSVSLTTSAFPCKGRRQLVLALAKKARKAWCLAIFFTLILVAVKSGTKKYVKLLTYEIDSSSRLQHSSAFASFFSLRSLW